MTSSSITEKSLKEVANLIKTLPTGTVFLFLVLNPLLTNDGDCQTVNKYLAGILFAVCGFSCFFSCFTDSYTHTDGVTYSGIAMTDGLWPWSGKKDLATDVKTKLSEKKLQPGDLVHALCSMLVFVVIVLLTADCVLCFYPSFKNQTVLIKVLPPVVATVSTAVSVLFPHKRHGIGYTSPGHLHASEKSESTICHEIIAGLANIIKSLPTGTVFLFLFLNPLVTNDGDCEMFNKYLGGFLLTVCCFSCFFSCFIDSYSDKVDGVTKIHYVLPTKKGMWLLPNGPEYKLQDYVLATKTGQEAVQYPDKLEPVDFLPALFSLLMFGVISLTTPDSIQCYSPSFKNHKLFLKILPPVVAIISGIVFVMYPYKRHGIGYVEIDLSSMGDKSLASLIKVLPTGTAFLFQTLSPVFTNDGDCKTVNKYLAGALFAVCGFSCFFSCFTDSYVGNDGVTHYGIATKTGLWPAQKGTTQDITNKKLHVADFVHAFFTTIIFGVVVLLTEDTVECYWPSFESNQTLLLKVLPPLLGSISSIVFLMFPNNRNGIGYGKTS